MSETKTFHAHSRNETDWLSIKVSNSLVKDWSGAVLKIALIHADGSITNYVPDIVTVLNDAETRLDSLLGPSGSIWPIAAGQYLPIAQVVKGSADFSIDCPGDVVVVD